MLGCKLHCLEMHDGHKGIPMEMLIGCAFHRIQSSKERDSFVTVVRDMMENQKVWRKPLALVQIPTWSVKQCLFPLIDTILGTLDHLDGPQL